MVVKFCLRLVCVLLTLPAAGSQELRLEVVTAISACSATCGVGVKTQTLCMLKDSQAALVPVPSPVPPEITTDCRERAVECVETWLCGIKSLTRAVGQSIDMDCAQDVMKVLGPYGWSVVWTYAPGIITTDNGLFRPWEAPGHGGFVLGPLQEAHAGTYRCDVMVDGYQRLKRMYWGLRVLPPGGIKNLTLHYSHVTQEGAGHLQQKRDDFAISVGLCVLLTVGVAAMVLVINWRHVQVQYYKLYKRKNKAHINSVPQTDQQEAV